ncbi:hypothetical protein Tco_0292090 [Tanacetum coccineum]
MTTSATVPQIQNVSPSANTTAPSQQELDLLFGPLYNEFFTAGTSSVNNSSSPTDNSNQQDTPPTMNIQSSTEPTTPTNVNAEEEQTIIKQKMHHSNKISNPILSVHQYEKLKTIEEAMVEFCNDRRQCRKTSNQFDRLKQVWEHVDKPFGKTVSQAKGG